MIAAWMLYSVAASAVLGICALALEHGMRRSGMPVRWLWAGALLASLVVSALPWLRSLPESRAVSTPERIGADVAPARPVKVPVYAAAARIDVPTPPALLSRLEAVDRPLLALWAMAAAVGVLYLLGTQRTLSRRRRLWRRTLLDGVPTLVSRDVGPAVVGFLDSAIVVPAWVMELDAEQRRLVLAHEEEHLRAGDVRLLSLALLATAVAPWNAALWWQLRRLRHAVELDCDARVLDGEADAERYCDLLIEVGARASMRGVAFAAFAESRSMLERRILSVVGPRPRRRAAVAGICVALAGLTLVYACEAPAPTLPGAGEAKEAPELVVYDEEIDPEPERIGARALPVAEPYAVLPDSTLLGIERMREAVAEARPVRDVTDQVAADDVGALVRRRYPEVYAHGLPPEQALWFVIDRNDRIVRSWRGQNIYVNISRYHPLREVDLPAGSAARARAVAEHQRLERSIMSANAPGMRVGGVHAALYQFAPNPAFTVHFVSVRPSPIPPGWRMGHATDAVAAALRAELKR